MTDGCVVEFSQDLIALIQATDLVSDDVLMEKLNQLEDAYDPDIIRKYLREYRFEFFKNRIWSTTVLIAG